MAVACVRCLNKLRLLAAVSPIMRVSQRSLSIAAPRMNSHVYLDVDPEPDLEYLLDPNNLEDIKANIASRKGVGDIDKVHAIFDKYQLNQTEELQQRLIAAALLIPNKSSPNTIGGSKPRVLRTHNIDAALSEQGENSEDDETVSGLIDFTSLLDVEKESSQFTDTCKWLGLLLSQNLLTSNLVYPKRSYFLLGQLAKLERVLVHWTLSKLRSKGWRYVSVPDLLPEQLVSSCGFVTTGKQNQIYKVRKNEGGLCFAGTSEIALAGLYAGRMMETDNPIKICTYSPCYRAEEARNKIDKGFYRLHQFTKVEMFGICTPSQSETLLEELVSIQCELFSDLGLGYRLLEMPSEELGAPAYKKYDVETWLQATHHWAEISSASNCTDYQSRRLAITTPSGEFAHTVNGTGCAVPRMLMAIIEQNYKIANRYIEIPDVLQPLMNTDIIQTQPDMLKFQKSWVTSRPNLSL